MPSISREMSRKRKAERLCEPPAKKQKGDDEPMDVAPAGLEAMVAILTERLRMMTIS